MPDEMDRAQEINEQFQEAALAEHQRNRQRGRPAATHCEECGDEIPEKRRQAMPGCRKCISCQEAHEIHPHWRAL
ncbi:MAG: TraR/DksA family transcriptional regulator [Geobacteraceae bacterium]|nr:TraR/DksA family transcriptional regulator [Geobacteraceae bacterium]